MIKKYKRLVENILPKIGSTVRLGQKRKESVWGLKMRKGTKMIVLGYDKFPDSDDQLLSLAFADEYNLPDFDSEMDYQIVYLDEVEF